MRKNISKHGIYKLFERVENMIQWLQSKIVMIVVGIVLISSMISVFYYRMDQIEDRKSVV